MVGALDGRREGSDVLAGGNRHDGIRVLDHDQTGYQREGRRSGFDGRNGDVTVVFAAFDRVAGIAGSRKDTCGTIPEYARDRSAVDATLDLKIAVGRTDDSAYLRGYASRGRFVCFRIAEVARVGAVLDQTALHLLGDTHQTAGVVGRDGDICLVVTVDHFQRQLVFSFVRSDAASDTSDTAVGRFRIVHDDLSAVVTLLERSVTVAENTAERVELLVRAVEVQGHGAFVHAVGVTPFCGFGHADDTADAA